MNTPDFIFVLIAALSVLGAGIVILINRRNTRKMLEHMNAMLASALDGSFSETVFDESMLSAIETKLAHNLSASAVSVKNLAKEKDKIKELITDISHQTKMPIANILLYAQLLNEQNLPQSSTPCVLAIHSQGEKLNFLISSLVKLSRLETGIFELHSQVSNVQPMLDNVLEQILPKSRAKDITVSVEPTQAVAFFDSKWTTEAIYNIVDNAVKYTPNGGLIQIKTTPYQLFCRIDITDNGIGIKNDEQTKIFGRFYRSASVRDIEGVGIGLYLSRQIISGENGYMKMKSTLGKGTTFSVFLPIET